MKHLILLAMLLASLVVNAQRHFKETEKRINIINQIEAQCVDVSLQQKFY